MPTQAQTELAHHIIDMVETAIRNAHPEIEKIATEYTVMDYEEESKPYKPNTLLFGETYYDLENEIIEILEEIGYTKEANQ